MPALTAAPDRRLRQAAAAIFLCALSTYAFVLPIFRDALQSYYGLGLRELGFFFSIGQIPAALGALAAGVLVDRWGPRSVLKGSLLGVGVGMATAFLGVLWGVMLLAVIVMSAFGQSLSIAAQSYLVRLFPESRRRVISLMCVVISIAGIGYPLFAEYLLRLHTQGGVAFGRVLHTPFAAMAAVMLLAAVFFRGAAPRQPAAPAAGARAKWYWPSFAPGTWALLALLNLHTTVDIGINIWLPRVLGSDSFATHRWAPGVVLAGYSLAYVVSRSILAALPERIGRRALMVAPGLLGGAAFLGGILARSEASTAIGYILGAFLWSLEFPTLLAAAAEREGERFGSVLTVFTVGQALAAFVVTVLMGWMGEALGAGRLWMILLPPAAGFPLVGLGGALWLWRYRRAKSD